MLEKCAPGHSFKTKLHHHWVTYGGRTYRGLPLGERGKQNPEIQVHRIRQMVRYLDIEECAAGEIPLLAGR